MSLEGFAAKALSFNKRARDVRPTIKAQGFEPGVTHILEVQSEQIGVLEKQCSDMIDIINRMATVLELVNKSNEGLAKEIDSLRDKYRNVDEETGRTNDE